MSVIDFKENRYDPHKVAELICVLCHKRWIAVYPAETLLKDIECPGCGKDGFAIKTGQELDVEDM